MSLPIPFYESQPIDDMVNLTEETSLSRIEDKSDEMLKAHHARVMTHVVIRRPGLRALGFGRLALQGTLKNLGEQIDLERLCSTLSRQLIAALEEVIGPTLSGSINAEFIELKRDLFNGRLPKRGLSPDAVETIHDRGPRTFNADLSLWCELSHHRLKLVLEGSNCFARECDLQRAAFRDMVRNSDFRRALALASPLLSKELAQYIGAEEVSRLKRVRRTEFSLARYYSRCTHKITPYSSFMKSGLWKITYGGEESTRTGTRTQTTRIRHSASLNRAMIRSLANALEENPEFREAVPVFWSSAISDAGDWMFVVARQYSAALPARLLVPQETIYRIRRSTAIEEIRRYLQRAGGSVLWKDLVSWLSDQSGSPDAAREYVDELIHRSILIHAIPFSDSHGSNVKSLRKYVGRIASPNALPLESTLRRLEHAESDFPKALPEARAGLIEQLDNSVKEAFSILREDGNPGWNGLHIYEDCIEEPTRQITLQAGWQDALVDLARFINLYGALLDGNISSRETLRRVHQSEFRGEPRPFLEVVKAYRSVVMAPSAVRTSLSAHTPNPCSLPSLLSLHYLREEIGKMASDSSNDEEIDFEKVANHHDWGGKFLRAGLAAPAEDVLFLSCYGQPIVGQSGAEGILLSALNHPLGAMARYMVSMSVLGQRDAVADAIRSNLDKIWPDAEPCELASVFDFNANLHPRITTHRIAYDNAAPLEHLDISLGEVILASESGRDLMLYCDRLDRRLVPIELGMMASRLRPLIHHLLLSIGNVDPVLHKNFFHPYHWSLCDGPGEHMAIFPRIIFGRCVLRRKGWAVPLSKLPQRGPKDNDYLYFILITKWCTELGLPDEVFVTADFSLKDGSRSADSRHSLNHRKPQYIRFGNILLLNVLEKLIAQVTAFLYIEEALPGRADLAALGLSRPLEFVADLCAPFPSIRQTGVAEVVPELHMEVM